MRILKDREPTSMAISKSMDNDKCWQGSGEHGTLVRCGVGGIENVGATLETVWRVLKKLSIETPYDFANTKELRTRTPTNVYTPMFTAALFTIAKR